MITEKFSSYRSPVQIFVQVRNERTTRATIMIKVCVLQSNFTDFPIQFVPWRRFLGFDFALGTVTRSDNDQSAVVQETMSDARYHDDRNGRRGSESPIPRVSRRGNTINGNPPVPETVPSNTAQALFFIFQLCCHAVRPPTIELNRDVVLVWVVSFSFMYCN